ncbi:MAG: hypothetical protein ABI591_17480 [Kofleriaceae bacterium]
MAKLKPPADEDELEDPTALPGELVDAVLSLEPMQRASLGAVIAGSLASELLDARQTLAALATKPQRKRGR